MTSIHWPRTMSDLLMDPASLRRSPDVCVFFVRSEPARSTSVSLEVCMFEGSWSVRGQPWDQCLVNVTMYMVVSSITTQELNRDKSMTPTALTIG